MKTKKLRRALALLLAAAMLLALCACGQTGEQPEETGSAPPAETGGTESPAPAESGAPDDTSVITFVDSAGRSVEIDRSTDKIGALMAVSYNYMLLLQQTDRVAACMSMNDWAYEVTEGVSHNAADIELIPNAADGLNVEQLLADGIELVFYWPTRDDVLQECDAVGLPCVGISTAADNAAANADEYIEQITTDVYLYAEALGNGAEAIAEDYGNYVAEKLHMVEDRLADAPEEEHKDVYWMRSSDDGLQAFCDNSAAESVCNLMGDYLVTVSESGSGNVRNISTYTTVTMEQLYEWDPDVIFMGRTGDLGIVMDNEQWASLTAVKDGAVYLCPTGVFNWDAGVEAPLMVLYAAKLMHPDYFEDLDMAEEIKYFYSHFMGYDMTDEQVDYMLNRLGPDGQ